MLLAACGVPDLTEIAERAVDAIEEADEPDEAGGAAAGAAEIEERPGRDTTLPIYPDAVRVNFGELTDTAFIVFYVSHDPLEDVIDFYVREIGDRGGVSHYRGAMGTATTSSSSEKRRETSSPWRTIPGRTPRSS